MSNQKYTKSQRVVHWLMAIIIISLLLMGFWMVDLEPPFKYEIYDLHKSFGVIVLILFAARIYNKFKHEAPEYVEGFKKIEILAAKATHHTLYLLMFLMPVSGWVMSNAKGYPVKLFGLELPFIVEKNKALGDFARSSHDVIAWLLVALITLHVLGVIKHAIFDKENLLKRMI